MTDDPDGLACHTIGHAAWRERLIRAGEEPPSRHEPHEARWAAEGPVEHPRDLDTVRDWLAGDGERLPSHRTQNPEIGCE